MFFYALLMERPTEEMMICWVDDGAQSNGEIQTMHYKEKGSELVKTISSEGVKINGDSGYVYNVHIDSLLPNTTYQVDVNGNEASFKTFSESLDKNDFIKTLIISDMHTLQGYNNSWEKPCHVQHFKSYKPDLIIIPGDATGNSDVKRFKPLLRDYLGQFNSNLLTPLLWVPGNHEMGTWVNPEDNNGDLNSYHYSYFVPNLSKIEPVGDGLHYGSIVIGNYFQIIALDTHGVTGTLEQQTSWLQSLTPGAENIYVVSHRGVTNNEFKIYHRESETEVPFIDEVPQTTYRNDGRKDDKYQVYQRENWFAPLYFNLGSNLKKFFCGHIHGPSVTKKLKPVDYTPETLFYFPAGNYNLINSDDGVRELGQGFRANATRYSSNQVPDLFEIGGELTAYPYYISYIYSDYEKSEGRSYNVNNEEKQVFYTEFEDESDHESNGGVFYKKTIKKILFWI